MSARRRTDPLTDHVGTAVTLSKALDGTSCA